MSAINSPKWDIIRLTARQRFDLLDALDCGYSSGYSQKATPFRIESVTIMVEHHPGLEMAYVVCPRMIAVSGLWFIHGGYLHPETKIKVYLPTMTGGVECFTGKVESCRLVAGNVHDVKAAFNLSLEIDDFLPPTPEPAPESTIPERVLIIEHDPLRADRMRRLISEKEVAIDIVAEIADALDVIEHKQPPVIVAHATARRARAVMKSLSIFGHTGGVVAMVPSAHSTEIPAIQSHGFAAAITWPLAKRQFISALRVASGVARVNRQAVREADLREAQAQQDLLNRLTRREQSKSDPASSEPS